MLISIVLYILVMFILGAIMGSFIGAMTWRMQTGRDWVRGRSECEHCHHQLAAIDLIPIVSYLALGGKCRYCHKPIGRRAILLELLTGAAFAISAGLYPSLALGQWTSPWAVVTTANHCLPVGLIVWLTCLVLMVALFTYDLQWRLLPNKLVFPLIAAALLYSAIYYLGIRGAGWATWLMNIGLGLLPITGIYGVLYLISGGRWIGLGDVKLGIAIGMLVPWWGGILVLFLSNLLGSLVSLPGLIRHKITGSSEIPFGPYLIFATYLVFLFGWLVDFIAH